MCVPAEHGESAAAKPPDLASVTLRKVTLRLIPFLFVLYIVAWLDRVNLGFAGLQMNSDLGFSSAAFGFGSGVFFLGYFLFAAIGFYGYSFWAPLVVKSLTGSSDVNVGIILGAISAVTIVLMALNSAHSDRTDERPWHVAVPLVIMAAGFFGCALLSEPNLAVLSLALIPIGHCAAYGPFWSMPTRFLAGAPAAAGVALVVTIANVGGFLGPTLIGALENRAGAHRSAFVLLGTCAVIAALLALRLRQVAVLRSGTAGRLIGEQLKN